MVFRKCLLPAAAAAAYAATVVLLLMAPAVRACSCLARPLCDSIEFADVVLRGEALQRDAAEDQTELTTYTMKVTEVFKGEEGVEYPAQIDITTRANSALCGIYLELGTEYLLDLYRSGDQLMSVGICGATQTWDSLDADDLSTLDDIDTTCGLVGDCGDKCGETQACLAWVSGSTEEYYCADVCDPSPCDEGEICTLENQAFCDGFAPCPPFATCATASVVAADTEVEEGAEADMSSAMRLAAGVFPAAAVLLASMLLGL